MRGSELHVFGAHRGDHHDPLIGFFFVHALEPLERGLAGVVQIIEEKQQRTAAADAP